MADNLQVTPGSGKVMAADEITDAVLGTATVGYAKIMDGTLDSTNKLIVDSLGQARMNPVYIPNTVQATNNKSTGSVASLAKAFVSNIAAGNSIIVVCGVGNGTAPTVTDGVNTYVQMAQIANGTAFNVAIFLASNVAAGATTVTVNNGGSTASIAMEIYEIAGLLAKSNAIAQPASTTSNTGTGTTASAPNFTAVTPNEFAVAAIGLGTAAQTITAGLGWTNDSGQQNPTTPAGLFSFVSMSQAVSSLGPVTPQATFTSEPWAIAVASFRPVLVGMEGTINIKQIAGAAVAIGSGAMDTGTQRMAIATDSPGVITTGTAGSASTQVVTIQGIASMTKLLVTPDANSAVNIGQIGGTSVDANSGNKSAGTIRVVIATDQPQLTNKLLVTPDANSAVNVAQINGVAPLMGAGSTGTGSPRVTLSTDQVAIATWGHGATGSGVPTGAVLQGVSDGTNLRGVLQAANALNSTGTGLQTAQIVAQFDDVAPTSITENQFGNLRMSANRNLYGTIRDAAGNERGANVDSLGNLNTYQTKGMSNRAISAKFTTLTRPANATAYTAGDSISDNATAASVTALSATISDTNDDPIFISEILILSSDTGLAGKRIRAYLFNVDPTSSSGVSGGDNAAYSQKGYIGSTVPSAYLGSFSGVLESGFSDGTVGRLVPSYADGAAASTPHAPAGGFVVTVPVSGAKTIYIQFQAVDGFTPSGNGTTIIAYAKGWQGRAA